MWNLLWAVAAICLIVWVLGFALDFTLGGLIHILLVVAVISIVVRLINWGMHRSRSA